MTEADARDQVRQNQIKELFFLTVLNHLISFLLLSRKNKDKNVIAKNQTSNKKGKDKKTTPEGDRLVAQSIRVEHDNRGQDGLFIGLTP